MKSIANIYFTSSIHLPRSTGILGRQLGSFVVPSALSDVSVDLPNPLEQIRTVFPQFSLPIELDCALIPVIPTMLSRVLAGC